MRLLLNIHRNALPPTKILFHVPTSTSAPLTTARLLTDIDAIVPLESGTWGLSDYVVEIAGGYECLHFEDVARVLQDGEEVMVRPLRKEEVRARRLGGREQISAGGVVLRDGIGWGRVAWQGRRGERPEVDIPGPGGDVREAGGETAGEDERAEEGAGVLRIMDRPASRTLSGSKIYQDAGERPRSILREPGVPSSRKRRSSVSFVDELVQAEEDDDEEEDEEDYEPDEEEDEDSDMEMDSDESVDDDTVVKGNVHKTANGRDRSVLEVPSSVSPPPSEEDTVRPEDNEVHGFPDPRTAQDGSLEENGTVFNHILGEPQQRKVKSRSSAAVPLSHFLAIAKQNGDVTEKQPEKRPKQEQKAPFTGTESTKSRNLRRKMQRALTARRKAGLEDPSITLTEFRTKYNDEVPKNEGRMTSEIRAPKSKASSGAAQADAEFQRRRQALLASLQNNGEIDVGRDVTSQEDDMDEEEEQSHAEMSQMETANDVSRVDDSASQLNVHEPASYDSSINDSLNEPESSTQLSQMDGANDRDDRNGKRKATDLGRSEQEAKQQRSRVLDVASSRRLVFGGLGLRNPKTKEDEERTRNKIVALGKRVPIINVKSKPAEPLKPKITPTSENTDLNAWKKKIVLTAVECWDEDVVLSTPPFPFVQRWDASQQIQRKKKKKRSRSAAAQEYEEEYDYSQQPYYDEGVDMDYGEESHNNEISQPSTITTHLSQESNGYNLYNTPLHHTAPDQSLPTPSPDLLDAEMIPLLPEDLTTLPPLTLSAIRPGAIIAFRQLEMGHSSWQPEISHHRTATIVPGFLRPKKADDQVHYLLAKRDRVPIEYDADGNRMPRKFGMPGTEAQEDANARGECELSYSQFIEGRVLREAPPGAELEEAEDADEDEDQEFGEEASEGIPEMMEQDEEPDHTAANHNDEPIEDNDDFYDEPESSSAEQTQPPPDLSQSQSQSLPSSSQNFLDSNSSSSGLSPPPPDEVVQVEDSQIKEEPVEHDISTATNAQPIGDMITAVSKGPLRRRAKTKRVMRRELRER